MLILLKFGNKEYYSGEDRIMKNASLQEAKDLVKDICKREEINNPYWVEIKNEKNEKLYEYKKSNTN